MGAIKMKNNLLRKNLTIVIICLFVITTSSSLVNLTKGKNQEFITNNIENESIFNPIEIVSTESDKKSYNPFFTIDNEGFVHAVWEDNTNIDDCGNDTDIFYKYRLANGEWSNTEVVSTESTENSTTPSITIDFEGNIHVAWFDETDYLGTGDNLDVFYKFKPYGGSWGITEPVSIDSNNSDVLFDSPPSIVTDQYGFLHIAWRDTYVVGEEHFFNIFYKFKSIGGYWSERGLISSATNYCHRPNLVIDSYGDLHVVWKDFDFYYKFKPHAGNWSDTETIPIETGYGNYPSLAIDSSDTLHLVWYCGSGFGGSGSDDDVFYSYRPYNGEWSNTEVVSTESDFYSRFPNLAVDTECNIHVAWFDFSDYLQSGNDGDVFYKMRTQDGDWSTTEVVSIDCDSPSLIGRIAVDSYGVHIIWRDSSNIGGSGSDYDILYRFKGTPEGYKQAFLFGTISNVQNEGSFFIFNAKKLVWLSFKPFEFNIFKSEELITLYGDGIGFFGNNLIFGRYNVKY